MRTKSLCVAAGVFTLLTALSPSSAQAAPSPPSGAPRSLSLRDAIERAMRTDPAIDSARANRSRSELAVLRSQLDRFSLRVDAFVTEQYRVTNLEIGRAHV